MLLMQLYHTRHKTAHRALQALFLQFVPLSRPRYQTDTSGYNTTCAMLERSTAPQRLQRVPDTSGAPLLWIHARQCSISKTMQARRGQLLPSADRWQVLHPAHLLTGQRLHLYQISPEASQRFPCPAACDLATGQRSGRVSLEPSTQWGSPVALRGGRRGTIGGYRRSSFGLSPNSQ